MVSLPKRIREALKDLKLRRNMTDLSFRKVILAIVYGTDFQRTRLGKAGKAEVLGNNRGER